MQYFVFYSVKLWQATKRAFPFSSNIRPYDKRLLNSLRAHTDTHTHIRARAHTLASPHQRQIIMTMVNAWIRPQIIGIPHVQKADTHSRTIYNPSCKGCEQQYTCLFDEWMLAPGLQTWAAHVHSWTPASRRLHVQATVLTVMISLVFLSCVSISPPVIVHDCKKMSLREIVHFYYCCTFCGEGIFINWICVGQSGRSASGTKQEDFSKSVRWTRLAY